MWDKVISALGDHIYLARNRLERLELRGRFTPSAVGRVRWRQLLALSGGIGRGTKKQTLVALACVLVTVVSLSATLAWALGGWSAERARAVRPHTALGHILAVETLRVLGDKGRVLVIAVDAQKAPETALAFDSFAQALGEDGRITIAAVETIGADSSGKAADPRKGLTPEQLRGILDRHRGVDGIVSFAGMPALERKEIKRLKPSLPKVLVASRSHRGLRRLLEREVVQAVIVPRFEFPAPISGRPGTTREWFDKYFQVVRSASELPPSE